MPQILMLESTASHNSSDVKFSTAKKDSFKLPQIEKPGSRGTDFPRKGSPIGSSKGNLHLPIIGNSQEKSQKQQPSYTQTPHYTQNASEQPDTFAMEVQERLKFVLEGHKFEGGFAEDQSDSNSEDFEAKISRNKEIIKKYKLKKEGEGNPNLEGKKKSMPIATGRGTQKKQRNESLYQKRAKQYKDVSSENRFLQKKKETLLAKTKEAGAAKEKELRRDKLQKELTKKKINSPRMKFVSNRKVLGRQPSQPNISITKNEMLFDSIQNFLENPRMKRNSVGNPSTSRKPKNNRQQLQEMVRIIESKLSTTDNLETKTEDRYQENSDSPAIPKLISPLEGTFYGDWRKIQLISHSRQPRKEKFGVVSSNFDKELDLISHYQQRSEESLEKYVDSQKFLLELELHQRNRLSEKNTAK